MQIVKGCRFDRMQNNISHEIKERAMRIFEKSVLLGVFQE